MCSATCILRGLLRARVHVHNACIRAGSSFLRPCNRLAEVRTAWTRSYGEALMLITCTWLIPCFLAVPIWCFVCGSNTTARQNAVDTRLCGYAQSWACNLRQCLIYISGLLLFYSFQYPSKFEVNRWIHFLGPIMLIPHANTSTQLWPPGITPTFPTKSSS